MSMYGAGRPPRRRPLSIDEISIGSLVVDWELFPGRYSAYLETIRKGTTLKMVEPVQLFELFFSKMEFNRKDPFGVRDESEESVKGFLTKYSKFDLKRGEIMKQLILRTIGELGLNLEYLENNLNLKRQFDITMYMKNEYPAHEIANVQFARWFIRALTKGVQPERMKGLLQRMKSAKGVPPVNFFKNEAVVTLTEFLKKYEKDETMMPVWPNAFLKYQAKNLCKQISYDLGVFYFFEEEMTQSANLFENCLPFTIFDENTTENIIHEYKKYPFITLKNEMIHGYINACHSLLLTKNDKTYKDRTPTIFEKMEQIRGSDLLDSKNEQLFIDLLLEDITINNLSYSYRFGLLNSIIKQYGNKKDESNNVDANGLESKNNTHVDAGLGIVQKVEIINAIKQISQNQILDVPYYKCLLNVEKNKLDSTRLKYFLEKSKSIFINENTNKNVMDVEKDRSNDSFSNNKLKLKLFLKQISLDGNIAGPEFLEILNKFQTQYFEINRNSLFFQSLKEKQCHEQFNQIVNEYNESNKNDKYFQVPLLYSQLWHVDTADSIKNTLSSYEGLRIKDGLPCFTPKASDLASTYSNVSDDVLLLVKSLLSENDNKHLVPLITFTLLKAHWAWVMKYFDKGFAMFELVRENIEQVTWSGGTTSLLENFYFCRLDFLCSWSLHLVNNDKDSKKVIETCEEAAKGCLEYKHPNAKILENLFSLFLTIRRFKPLDKWKPVIRELNNDMVSRHVFKVSLNIADLYYAINGDGPTENDFYTYCDFIKSLRKPKSSHKRSSSGAMSKSVDTKMILESMLKKIKSKEMMEFITCLLSNIYNNIIETEYSITYTRLGKIGKFVAKLTRMMSKGSSRGDGADYKEIYPDSIQNLLSISINYLCKHYPNEHNYKLILGDFLICKSHYRESFITYLGVGSKRSRMFEEIKSLPNVWDQIIIRRMVDCLVHMKAFIQAAAMAQLLQEKDCKVKFNAIQRGCSELHVSGLPMKDSYYKFFWDKQTLELLIHIHKKMGDSKREELANLHCQNPDNNWINEKNHQSARILQLQTEFLLTITREFMI